MAEREPLYRDAADYTVSTEGRSASAVSNEILSILRR
jgi:shikimate kinase